MADHGQPRTIDQKVDEVLAAAPPGAIAIHTVLIVEVAYANSDGAIATLLTVTCPQGDISRITLRGLLAACHDNISQHHAA